MACGILLLALETFALLARLTNTCVAVIKLRIKHLRLGDVAAPYGMSVYKTNAQIQRYTSDFSDSLTAVSENMFS